MLGVRWLTVATGIKHTHTHVFRDIHHSVERTVSDDRRNAFIAINFK